MAKKIFRILSIDGGGIRGIYSAYLLQKIKNEFEINLKDHFDMIAGTSTGSIIASAIVCDIPMEDIVNLYKEKGCQIFSKKPWWKLPKYFSSKFKSNPLKQILDENFRDIKLGDISKPLILPASNITTGKVYVSKSFYDKNFTRDKHIKLSDAVLASCSAPTYFDPHSVGEALLADGGLWANNPSLVAVIEAKRRNIELEDIRILSVGTGLYKPEYKYNTKCMGFFTGWKRSKLIEYILSLQSQSTDNYLDLLLRKEQKFRLNFESNMELSLDDSKTIKKLIAKANEDFTYESDNIKKFLEINKGK